MDKLKEFTTRKQELHCSLAFPYLRYLEELYGLERMEEEIEPLGLSISYLKNKNNWMSFSYYTRILEKIVQITGDELVIINAPSMLNQASYFDFLVFLIYTKIWSGSPKWIYKIAFKEYKRFEKVGFFRILSSTRNTMTVEARLFKGYKQTKYNC